MPNARDKSKKFVAAWIPGPLKRQLKLIARSQNKTLSQLCEELITTHVEGAAVNSPAILADAAVSGAISEVAATPPPGPVSYRSKPKAARRSKARPAPGSPKKAP